MRWAEVVRTLGRCCRRPPTYLSPHARTKPNQTKPTTDAWEVPRQTWILDSLPGAVHRDRAIGEHSVAAVIEALRRVPMPQPTKEGLVQHLTHAEKIPPFIAHWLMTSLQRQPGPCTSSRRAPSPHAAPGSGRMRRARLHGDHGREVLVAGRPHVLAQLLPLVGGLRNAETDLLVALVWDVWMWVWVNGRVPLYTF